jgi:hypothetical protein
MASVWGRTSSSIPVKAGPGTCPETLDLLRARGVEVHVEETRAAVRLYNGLGETQPVGGLFHSTC